MHYYWVPEQSLPNAGKDQPPDDIEDRAVLVELADQHQTKTGYRQAASCQPA